MSIRDLQLDRLLRFCLGSSPPICRSAHHGMSLFSPSLLATSAFIFLIHVFLWRQGGRFFTFCVSFLFTVTPLLGPLCMCSLFASILLRHRSRFIFSPMHFDVFYPEYLIVSHSAAFCNHYAFADLCSWIGLGFVFSADEDMGCVPGLVGWCRHRRRRKQRLPRNLPRVVVVVANRRRRFVLLLGLLWRRCIP